MVTTRLGIVTGLKSESSLLLNALNEAMPRPAIMVQCRGMGPERAQAAAETLIRAGCTALMSVGIAGGLAPHLETGTLLLPRTVLRLPAAEKSTGITVDSRWHLALSSRFKHNLKVTLSTGPVVSAPYTISDAEAKSKLHSLLGAVAVDMESYAVATCAQSQGVPFLALRVVADHARCSIPAPLSQAVTADGDIDTRKAAISLLKAPWLIKEARTLHKVSQRAHSVLDSLFRSDLLGRSFLVSVAQE